MNFESPMEASDYPISPFDMAREDLSATRKRLIEINDSYLIERPILEKKADGLERFIQAYGEVEEFKSELKQTNREAFDRVEARKKAESQKKAAPEQRSYTPRISTPRTLREVLSPTKEKPHSKSDDLITEDVVLKIAEYIEREGPVKTGVLYPWMVKKKHLEELGGTMPVKSFGIRLGHVVRENPEFSALIQYDRDSQLWSLTDDTKQLPQRAIKDMREEARHVGSTSIDPKVRSTSNGTAEHLADHSVNTNGQLEPPINSQGDDSDERDPALAGLDRELRPFVMAVNIIFREQDNQPMGAKQIWAEIDEEKMLNVSGVSNYGEFCKKLTHYADFFAYDPIWKTYHPLKPLGPDPMELTKRNGEKVAV